MQNYSKWPIQTPAVSALQLDPMNPRLPRGAGKLTEREIISDLVEHEDVVGLAKDIATQGYFPTETLVGVRVKGRIVVLEGNRRVAALKLLRNPELAPQEALERFRRIAEDANPPTRVRVVIAPSREAATAILLSRHTSQQIQAWRRPMQARFYRQLVEGGLSPETIADRYGVTAGQVQQWIRADQMYELACSLDFPADVKATVTNPRDFPLSNLERLLETSAVRDFLHLSSDPKAGFVTTARSGQFLKAFRRIVADVATGAIDSRTANDEDARIAYVSRLRELAPAATSKKKPITEILTETVGDSAPLAPAPPRPRRTQVSDTALPRNLRCYSSNARVCDVFEEVRRLKLRRYKNSSAIMLRVLLELGLTEHLYDRKEMEPLIQSIKSKQPKRTFAPDWSPSLRQMLEHLLTLSTGIQGLELKALNKFLHKEGGSASLESLDGYVHNRRTGPTEADVQAIAGALEPVLRLILAKPDVEE